MRRPHTFPITISTPIDPGLAAEALCSAASLGARAELMSAHPVLGWITCGNPGDSDPEADTIEAPQPALARASWWSSARRRLDLGRRGSTHEPTIRESAIRGREQWRHLGSDPLVMHPRVYTTNRSSLSVRFAVHETSRVLDTGRSFGRHVRSLRRARGMTQEVLAERCGLSADTIRRLEHGSFSPSLDTLRKLCGGLDLMLSTLFESYELGSRNEARELMDLLATRSPRELVLATRILRALFAELDGYAAGAGSDPASSPPLDEELEDELDEEEDD